MYADERQYNASATTVTLSPCARLCLQIDYPEIEEGTKPRHRFMSAYEQRKEAQDKKYQFLLFAADPYEVIAFKIPNNEVDRSDRLFSYWYVLLACTGILSSLALVRRCSSC